MHARGSVGSENPRQRQIVEGTKRGSHGREERPAVGVDEAGRGASPLPPQCFLLSYFILVEARARFFMDGAFEPGGGGGEGGVDLVKTSSDTQRETG